MRDDILKPCHAGISAMAGDGSKKRTVTLESLSKMRSKAGGREHLPHEGIFRCIRGALGAARAVTPRCAGTASICAELL